MRHRRRKRALHKRILMHTLVASVLCSILFQNDILNVEAAQGQTSSTDVLNVTLTTGGQSSASMGKLAEGTYTATDNTIGRQKGQIKLDNTSVGGYMHANIGQTIDMYAPSADRDYTDKIGYSGNYTFLAAGGKGGDIDAVDKWHGKGAKAQGGYGTAVTTNSIDYSSGQSITYRKGSNGQSYGRDVAQNSKKWDYNYLISGMKSVNPMGKLDGLLYGEDAKSGGVYTAYTATAQAGTASYIQTSGSNYIVAGGGAPGAVLFEADKRFSSSPEYRATGTYGTHADKSPTIPSGYAFYDPSDQSQTMVRHYSKYAGTGNVNAGRIAGTAVKNNCYDRDGRLHNVDIFYGWLEYGKGTGINAISPVYPGYSGSAARSGSVFTPNNAVSVGLNTSITSSTPTCQLKCNAKYVTINDPTRKGYTFDGWTCGSGVSIVSDTSTSTKFKVTSSGATITAKWKNLNPVNVKLHAENGGKSYVVTDTSADVTTGWFNTPFALWGEAEDPGDSISSAAIRRVDSGRNDTIDNKTYNPAVPSLNKSNASFKNYEVEGTTSLVLTATDSEGAASGRPLQGSTSTRKLNVKIDTTAPSGTVKVSLGTYEKPKNTEGNKTWEEWNVYNSRAYGAKVSIELSDENANAAGGKNDVSGLNRVWMTIYDTDNPENRKEIVLAEGLNGATTYEHKELINVNTIFPNVMNLTYEVRATDMTGNEMPAVIKTSERKPEIYAKVVRLTEDDEIEDPVQFKAGYRGQVHVYTTGWVDTISFEWPECIVKSGEYDVAHGVPGMLYNANLIMNGMYQGMEPPSDPTAKLIQDTVLGSELVDEHNLSSKAIMLDVDGENTGFTRAYTFDFWIPEYIGRPENPHHIDMSIVNQVHTKITANKYIVKKNTESVSTESVVTTNSFFMRLGEGSIFDNFHSSIIG